MAQFFIPPAMAIHESLLPARQTPAAESAETADRGRAQSPGRHASRHAPWNRIAASGIGFLIGFPVAFFSDFFFFPDQIMAFSSNEHSPEQLLHTFGLTSGPVSSPEFQVTGRSHNTPDTSAPGTTATFSEPSFSFSNLSDFSGWVDRMLTLTGCSDIYLSPEGVHLLVQRTLQTPPIPVVWSPEAAERVLKWMAGTMDQSTARQERFYRLLNENGSADISWTIGRHRFRVSVFYTREQTAFVLRHIPPGIRHFSHLMLPPAVFTHLLEHLHRGWLLIAGPCGSGKSTTLSACIEFWNTHRSCHILVIEDPIEYFYKSRKSLIHQREVGTDTSSFAQALRSALRQSPQIIVIGEVRDEETARLALQAAETGHLVATTIHAPHSFGALRRLTGFFPEVEQSRIWGRLVESFSAVISQVLVPSSALIPASATTGSPVPETYPARDEKGTFTARQYLPAIEILRSSFHIRQLLVSPHCTRELITEAIENARDEYMISMDDYLYLLISSGQISLETALTVAQSPSNLKLRVTSGIEKY